MNSGDRLLLATPSGNFNRRLAEKKRMPRQRNVSHFIIGPDVPTVVAALGVARLGWLAAVGDFPDVARPPPISQAFVPNGGRRSMLVERLASFQAWYSQLSPFFPT